MHDFTLKVIRRKQSEREKLRGMPLAEEQNKDDGPSESNELYGTEQL